ncbi:ABC transporter substrate-binding protein [Magnetospirillum sp. UT-4]|uniref:substrate-binding periplasmic protein n=1 Tax=Magnetospirillum sp. UT-4 TaxID=2681467 RepID=UPI0013819A26|nr:transporter substrate-binding domain-containing protein [Magnetospirillum sp. UT-4]CAA7627121.1 putative ABC transporter, periplasmic domain [Magnetospirillum sp. UT-4]
MRRLLMILGLMATLAVPARAETTLVLAADPWCPHTCEPDSPQPGYMIELARKAFALRGVRVVYKSMPWSRAMADVRAGRIDGAVGALAGEADGLILHRHALGKQVNAFATRPDESWSFAGLDSLRGRVVGITQDYSYSPEIDSWLAGGHTQVQPLAGENALGRNLRKLAARRVDVVVEDEAVLRHTQRHSNGGVQVRIAGRMAGGDLFVAFTPKPERRGADYAEMLDQGLKDLRTSGEFQRVLAEYGLPDWNGQR